MSAFLRAVFVVGVSLSTTTITSAAGPDARMNVLGVYHGDTPDQVSTKLRGQGFRPSQYNFANTCNRSFNDVVKENAARNSTSIDAVSCGLTMEDNAGRRIKVYFYLFPEGYRTSSVEYSMPFTAGRDAWAKVLRDKYGAPTGTFRSAFGPIPSYTGKSPLDAGVAVRGGVSEAAASLTMERAADARDSSIALTKALGARTGGGNVKL